MQPNNPTMPSSSIVIEEISSDQVEPQVSPHEQVQHVQPADADSPQNHDDFLFTYDLPPVLGKRG